MQCQNSGCTNVGAYSCNTCGLFICGRHASIREGYVECPNCWRESQEFYARQRVIQAAEDAKVEKKYNRGLIFICTSVGLGILGLILAVAGGGGGSGMGSFGLLLVVLGIIGFIIGFAHFMG